MDYVEWVESVGRELVTEWKAADPYAQFMGITVEQVAVRLGLDGTDANVQEAIRDALSDLTQTLGLLDRQGGRYYKPTQEGQKLPEASLSTCWPGIMEIFLAEEQTQFLKQLVSMCEENYQTHVCVRDTTGEAVFTALGKTWDNDGIPLGYRLADELAKQGMIWQQPTMGGHITLYPTYLGFVRVTRQLESTWVQNVRDLLPDWETTNVDFKRELNLGSEDEKAEFVRDVLGLATTKSSGRRLLIIGFDNKSKSFVKSVDGSITQERLEQILHRYSEPTPLVRFHQVPWETGEIGVIEVHRELEKIPYRVSKDLGNDPKRKIRIGEIYVRHGSHTEPPTERERADLEEEGRRAREHSA